MAGTASPFVMNLAGIGEAAATTAPKLLSRPRAERTGPSACAISRSRAASGWATRGRGASTERRAARAQTRLSDMPAVLRSRSISLGAIWASGNTSLAAPWWIASRGMPKTTQLASSWQ